ncbi:hypothetical protein ACIBF6_45225 [Streptosporangium amethystogenes]|uniref:hypothetical protein n=1 Tax=Streptosporangium amethystogenes TaxID=2002 RepID=UPI00379D7F98
MSEVERLSAGHRDIDGLVASVDKKDLIERALVCPRGFADGEHARERIAARIPPMPCTGGAGQWSVAESRDRPATWAEVA